MAKARILAAAALLVVGPAAALAGSGEYQNLNAMGLASEKGIRTKCDLYGQHEGKTYCFRDENAKSEFMKDPAGNRARADAYYGSKANDPNWTPCDYTGPPTDPNSCN
jgi:hypothetical protein